MSASQLLDFDCRAKTSKNKRIMTSSVDYSKINPELDAVWSSSFAAKKARLT